MTVTETRIDLDVGEDATFRLVVEKTDGLPGERADLTGAEIELAVRRGPDDGAKLLTKTVGAGWTIADQGELKGEAVCVFLSADTFGTSPPLKRGNYRFDVRLRLAGGQTKYPVKGILVVGGVNATPT
jgi:hypothetical protein